MIGVATVFFMARLLSFS